MHSKIIMGVCSLDICMSSGSVRLATLCMLVGSVFRKKEKMPCLLLLLNKVKYSDKNCPSLVCSTFSFYLEMEQNWHLELYIILI